MAAETNAAGGDGGAPSGEATAASGATARAGAVAMEERGLQAIGRASAEGRGDGMVPGSAPVCIPGDGVINDVVADRLLNSLEELEADYQRTMAVDRSHSGHDAAEPDGNVSSESDGGDVQHGYAALGSEDEGSDDDFSGWVGARPEEPSDGSNDAGAEAALPHSTDVTTDVGGLEGAPTAWPAASTGIAPEGSTSSQATDTLGGFADFGATNPAMPLPPPFRPHLQTTVLSGPDVQLIKQTMGQLNIKPPPWAQNMPDHELQRMMKKCVETP